MSTFADSIILSSTEPNKWDGEADPNYAHPGGRFGGWTAAALIEAVRREPGERGAPLSLTMLYLDPIKDGPVQIGTRLLRAGKRIQFWRAELRQGDTLCAHAQITFGELAAVAEAVQATVVMTDEDVRFLRYIGSLRVAII